MTTTEKPSIVSMGGSTIFRHEEAKPFESPRGEMCLEQISEHIQTHLGTVESVFHEIVSDTVHIDVHFVKPSRQFPFIRLVTSGMSDLPMTTPQGADTPRYLELVMTLPGYWRLDQDSFKDEAWYWPVRLLKGLARLPHKYNTWLARGHTIPHADPAQAYASNTKLCGAIILPSATTPDGFYKLRIDEHKEIVFLCVVPLYEEEMNLKLRLGSDELLNRLDKIGVNDIIDPARRNAAKKRFGLF